MAAASPQVESWRAKALPWYAVTLLMLVYMCSSIDRLVVSIIIEPLKEDFQLSDSQIGLLSGLAFSAPFALASLPVGWLVDRMKRILLLVGMVTVWSGATMLAALPFGFAWLVACRALVGAAEAGVHPISLSLIADFFRPDRRATAVGLFATGTALSTLVVFMLGGWILAHYSWHTVFLMAGIPGIILAGVIAVTLREPVRGRYDQVGAERAGTLTVKETVALLFRSKPLLHAITAHMLATGVQYAIVIWIVSFMVRIHGISTQQAAIWVGLGMGIFQTAGSLLSGPLADKLCKGDPARGAIWLVCASLACWVASILLFTSASVNIMLIFLCIECFCAGAVTGPSYALLVGTSPSHARGSMLAFSRLVSTLIGNSGLAFLAGAVSDGVGGDDSIQIGLMVTGLAFLWAALHYFLVSRAWRRSQSTIQRSPAPS